jgi:hypothetical protein
LISCTGFDNTILDPGFKLFTGLSDSDRIFLPRISVDVELFWQKDAEKVRNIL